MQERATCQNCGAVRYSLNKTLEEIDKIELCCQSPNYYWDIHKR